MSLYDDRVKETSTSTGAGPFALAGAMTGFRTFASVSTVGDVKPYTIQGVDANGAPTGEWETGIGTYSAANTLTRTTVLSSSNGGAAVSFAAGTKQVWVDLPAARIPALTVSTWANRPTAPSVGDRLRATDIGREFIYESGVWAFASNRPFAQAGVPVILAPSGTVAADGTLTLGTALPTTYSGGAWVRLPAGAVSGGLAGMYWAVFSSATVAAVKTLFVDPAAGFVPYVPTGTLTAAVGFGAAYTQTINADITLCATVVPGGIIGPNGSLRESAQFSFKNSANATQLRSRFGADIAYSYQGGNASAIIDGVRLRNRGSLLTNISPPNLYFSANYNGDTATFSYSSINTAVDQNLMFMAQISAATDYVILESFSAEILPA